MWVKLIEKCQLHIHSSRLAMGPSVILPSYIQIPFHQQLGQFSNFQLCPRVTIGECCSSVLQGGIFIWIRNYWAIIYQWICIVVCPIRIQYTKLKLTKRSYILWSDIRPMWKTYFHCNLNKGERTIYNTFF